MKVNAFFYTPISKFNQLKVISLGLLSDILKVIGQDAGAKREAEKPNPPRPPAGVNADNPVIYMLFAFSIYWPDIFYFNLI